MTKNESNNLQILLNKFFNLKGFNNRNFWNRNKVAKQIKEQIIGAGHWRFTKRKNSKENLNKYKETNSKRAENKRLNNW